MDEAVKEAFKAVHEKLDGHIVDFKTHTKEDEKLREQVTEWAGQLKIIKWLSSAILTAMLAYGVKHW